MRNEYFGFELLGNKLREKRKAAGLTQKEISEATGMSIDVIKNIEAGRNISDSITTRNRIKLYQTAVRILPQLKKARQK